MDIKQREVMLEYEEQMKQEIRDEQWYAAWMVYISVISITRIIPLMLNNI